MWQSYINGLGLGAGLIMAIGAQNLFVLTQGLRREHPLTAALVCVVCDCLLICAGVFGLARLLASEPLLLELARWGGALFLIGYAARALYRAWRPGSLEQTDGKALRSRRTVLLTTLAVTLLNPHVYLDTVVLLGSLGSAQTLPAAFAGGAMSASLLWFLCLALGAARLAPWLAQPRIWRAIDLLVALMLLAIASQLILTPTATP
ncbi:LysE/ArgO family amino acid transporter [Pseudomonas mangrovi]|uniref:Lysine transporter LysE n=1 Tax=Pseudomonas mangrovi TaxID=2161748 RepID=A0A2T5PEQ7_9PSED|nr:LysE/ArgO family amino acid transporter [Pseudomonas mangrovi]PTU76208.1 lysine transporter LysE [Pseudomonas mangrovi]